MDMRIFQVHSNKALPHVGSILIASPLLYDYHFARSVILMVTHNIEGSMGIVMKPVGAEIGFCSCYSCIQGRSCGSGYDFLSARVE